MSELIQKKILKSIEDVPSLPLTALKIIRLANDINSPPHEMLETIKVDPVITAKVLKMINSSYFGLGANITDLRQALVMLGNNTIKNLALSSALLNTMKAKETGHEKLDLDAVWLHSLGVAVAAKIIAQAAKLPRLQHDEYFIVGLLHDIGTIFSFQFLAEEYLQILDLQEDPGEMVNLAKDPSYRETLLQHRQFLKTWGQTSNDLDLSPYLRSS